MKVCLSFCLYVYLCLCIFHLVYLSVHLSYPFELEGARVSIVSPDLEPVESLSVCLSVYLCLCIFHLVYLSVYLSYPFELEGARVSIVSPDLGPDESPDAPAVRRD
jgi:hypothetical protein